MKFARASFALEITLESKGFEISSYCEVISVNYDSLESLTNAILSFSTLQSIQALLRCPLRSVPLMRYAQVGSRLELIAADTVVIFGIRLNRSSERFYCHFVCIINALPGMSIGSIIMKISLFVSNQQFERLEPVRAASYDSYETSRRDSCFEGTRAALLSGIRSWMNDPQSQSIYVLYGIARIGKSTVAKTVAERAARDKVLGASFFFSRGGGNKESAKSFFPTLAYYISYHHRALATRINKAVEEDPELTGRGLVRQFDQLITQPLQTPLAGQRPILLVIDALDECDEHDVGTILSLFMRDVPRIPRLKVFITARPEKHIRAILNQCRDQEQFHLQDIDESIVEADIRSYVEFRLSAEQVQRALPDLRSPIWQPTKKQNDMLVGMSGKLFIIAVTTTRFILDPKHANPAKQLAILLDGVSHLDFSGSKHNTFMDKVYMGIIHAAQPDPVGNWADLFKACVGTLMLLHDPLPSDAVTKLINIDVDETLSNLHSLLAPSGRNQIFRIHHTSFLDFITNLDRCKEGPQFYIDRTAHHLRLAKCCLRTMNRLLEKNISGLEPTDWYKDRAQILHRIRHSVSPCLAYACTYWASHLIAALKDGTELDRETEQLLESFASGHLLMWLEALSIIGRVDTAYLSLDKMRTIRWYSPSTKAPAAAAQSFYPREKIQELFSDGCRFIERNLGALHSFPMQIYSSALPFVPRDTALFRAYGRSHTNSVKIISGAETAWDTTVAILKGHSDAVCCVVFSADGSRLATASKDCTIRLWDSKTGHNITTLWGHTRRVNSVAFSKDGTQLASASTDGTIRLWNEGKGKGKGKGKEKRKGKGRPTLTSRLGAVHCGAVYCVTYSTTGLRLASASSDRTVRLWDGGTGSPIITLQGHSHYVKSVAFSPDGLIVASASYDKTVQLWDCGTGHCIASMTGHYEWVNSVVFSPDGSRLASASDDHTIRLWNGRTGHHITTLNGHTDYVSSVAFSADDSRIASGSHDKTVQLWHGRTGNRIATLEGHSNWVRSVAFSPDGSMLASASDDRTVRLWDSSTISPSPSNSHSCPVNSVAFSPDGSKFASASDDQTVWLWDGQLGIHTATLKGHTRPVEFVIFSADGSKLASASRDRMVRLWDSETGQCTATLTGYFLLANSIMATADNLTLALTSGDNMAWLWDGRNQAVTLTKYSGSAVRGKRLILPALPEGSAFLKFTASDTLSDHSDTATLVKPTFASPRDHAVLLWDGETGDHIATLDGHSDVLRSVTISADGSRLISKSRDNVVMLWDISDIARPRVLCEKTATDVFYLHTRNCLYFLETRTDPALCDLTISNLGSESPFDTRVICRFPPNLSPELLAVNPAASTAAVVCINGRILFLDISGVSLS